MLRDQVAVVTGGAQGIGLATTRLFLKNGAKVVVADLDRQGGQVRKTLRARKFGVAGIFWRSFFFSKNWSTRSELSLNACANKPLLV
jgi:NAD(P)-dependent dehydrogenase (short-subunit alcohol dehydrogenase family)